MTDPETEPAAPEPEPHLPLARPEPVFAARVPAPEPERSLPARRRVIFLDIENTSRAEHVAHVIDRLAIDRLGRRTELIAVGNWRVIGSDAARVLARQGAQLVHSAPSTGVRDWSDLRIAVSAGVWLAGARPGDVMEIVSEDRAFDAVGDVAATLGIEFRRLSYRTLAGAPAARDEAPPAPPESRGRRDRRGPGRARREPRPAHAAGGERRRPEPARHAVAGRQAEAAAAPHTAPHDEIIGVVRDLVDRASGQPVLLDTLANELKARGFRRPPGSPRLVTRLRRIKEVSVSPTGMIALVGAPASASAGPVAEAPPAPLVRAPVAVAEASVPEVPAGQAAEPSPPGQGRRRRRSRRGGRRRRRGGAQAAGASTG